MTINEFEMARVINESYYDGMILIDPTYTFGIILNLDHPETSIPTRSRITSQRFTTPSYTASAMSSSRIRISA